MPVVQILDLLNIMDKTLPFILNACRQYRIAVPIEPFRDIPEFPRVETALEFCGAHAMSVLKFCQGLAESGQFAPIVFD